jgi:hypothetical protein
VPPLSGRTLVRLRRPSGHRVVRRLRLWLDSGRKRQIIACASSQAQPLASHYALQISDWA